MTGLYAPVIDEMKEKINRIIVMESGRVVGFDSHDNLLKSCEIYREIFTLQTQDSGDFDKPK